MSALLDSLAASFAGDATGRAALDDVLRLGLPQPRSEAWKYTSLRALERRSFSASTAAVSVPGAQLESIPSPRLVFVNGHHDAVLSNLEGLPAGVSITARGDTRCKSIANGSTGHTADDVFVRIGLALATRGVSLHASAGTRADSPIHLVFVGTTTDADLAWHLRSEILLSDGAEITVVEHQFACGPHAHLDNGVMHVDLSRGSRLTHARVQSGSSSGTSLLRTEATIAASARYERVDLELGASLSRHELVVRMTGPGAALVSNGVMLAQGRRHVDTRVRIEHNSPESTSQLNWRGLATDRGRVVFRGGITIHPGADGSDARLSNKNLLLSDAAEIDTQPVLEIHADEVKAAHGATVGQLDPDAMFYLRARGLGEGEARILLTAAFCREPVATVFEGTLRDILVSRIDESLSVLRGGPS